MLFPKLLERVLAWYAPGNEPICDHSLISIFQAFSPAKVIFAIGFLLSVRILC